MHDTLVSVVLLRASLLMSPVVLNRELTRDAPDIYFATEEGINKVSVKYQLHQSMSGKNHKL